MSADLRSLVEYINGSGLELLKTAQHSGKNSISKMQMAIQELAKDVTKYSGTSINQNKQTEDKDFGERRSARDSFNNFIVNHYINEKSYSTQSVGGKEYTPDPTKVKQEEKDPSKLIRMQAMMDTLYRIGHEKVGKERMADGVWDFRTHNALRNVYSFAQSFYNLIKDFELQVPAHIQISIAELNKFAKFVYEDDKKYTPQQKLTAAPQFEVNIEKIRKLYEWTRGQVLENPKYKSFIDEKQVFTSYGTHDKYGGIEYSAPEKSILDKVKSNPQQAAKYTALSVLPEFVMDGVKYSVTLNDLKDKKSFSAWKQNNNLSIPDEELVKKIKDGIQTNLTAFKQYQAAVFRRSKGSKSTSELFSKEFEQTRSLILKYNSLMKTSFTWNKKPVDMAYIIDLYNSSAWHRSNSNFEKFLNVVQETNSIIDQVNAIKKRIADAGYADISKAIPPMPAKIVLTS